MRLNVAGGFLAVALLLGGGGSPTPFPELGVQLAALAALGIWHFGAHPREPAQLDRAVWTGAGFLVLIGFLQLVPVPPVLWSNLPGRENVVAAVSFIGRADEWRPMSIAPARTFAALLALIPPIAMLWFAGQMKLRELTSLLWVLAGVGLLSAVVATLQVGTGDTFIFYQAAHPTRPPGIMASRNAQADLLLFAMLATIALAVTPGPRMSRAGRRAVAVVVLVVLATALVLSGSRTGLVMLIIPLATLVHLWGLSNSLKVRTDKRRLLFAAAATLAVIAGIGVAVSDNAVVLSTLDRFKTTTDGRLTVIWPDGLEAARVLWPAGGGIGTFIPAFESVESLESVDLSAPHRAHNDYLEFIIEGGLPALILLVVGIPALLWRAIVAARATRGRPAEPIVIFSSSVLLIVALHSVVDYPLRAMTIAVVAALAVGSLSKTMLENSR